MKSLTCLFYAFVTACMGLIASSFSSEITYLVDPQVGGLTPSPEPWRTVILGI